jgi:hypothetical protein
MNTEVHPDIQRMLEGFEKLLGEKPWRDVPLGDIEHAAHAILAQMVVKSAVDKGRLYTGGTVRQMPNALPVEVLFCLHHLGQNCNCKNK